MTENPLDSIKTTMSFDPRDWANSGKRDAWLYGVVVGWDESLDEVCTKYRWDEETKQRLIRLNQKYRKLMKDENGTLY